MRIRKVRKKKLDQIKERKRTWRTRKEQRKKDCFNFGSVVRRKYDKVDQGRGKEDFFSFSNSLFAFFNFFFFLILFFHVFFYFLKGQLGSLFISMKSVAVHPQIITVLENEEIELIACGGSHSVAVGTDGRIWTWG